MGCERREGDEIERESGGKGGVGGSNDVEGSLNSEVDLLPGGCKRIEYWRTRIWDLGRIVAEW